MRGMKYCGVLRLKMLSDEFIELQAVILLIYLFCFDLQTKTSCPVRPLVGEMQARTVF